MQTTISPSGDNVLKGAFPSEIAIKATPFVYIFGTEDDPDDKRTGLNRYYNLW